MKKYYIISIVFLTLTISCSKDENIKTISSEKEYNPESYNYSYMQYPFVNNPNVTDSLVNIGYDTGNRIIKRTGGVIGLYSVGYFFSKDKYDELTYSENQISIVQKSSSTFYSFPPFERKILLDNQNRPFKKYIYDENGRNKRDTINYFYDKNGLLNETKTGIIKKVFDRAQYYYNEKGNLDSIVTKRYYQTELLMKTLEVFSQYDDAPNPLKKLNIFEETFMRSISKNNFTKYEKKVYDDGIRLVSSEFKVWKLSYDNRGDVMFDKY